MPNNGGRVKGLPELDGHIYKHTYILYIHTFIQTTINTKHQYKKAHNLLWVLTKHLHSKEKENNKDTKIPKKVQNRRLKESL